MYDQVAIDKTVEIYYYNLILIATYEGVPMQYVFRPEIPRSTEIERVLAWVTTDTDLVRVRALNKKYHLKLRRTDIESRDSLAVAGIVQARIASKQQLVHKGSGLPADVVMGRPQKVLPLASEVAAVVTTALNREYGLHMEVSELTSSIPYALMRCMGEHLAAQNR